MLLNASKRSGMTLLEIIFAMAIFLMSTVAIYHLLQMGSDNAVQVRLQARTSMRCQGKLAEIMASNTPLTPSGSYMAFDDPDSDLQWKSEVSDDVTGLKTVKVWVKADLGDGLRSVESFITQMVLDPTMRGSTFDLPDAPKYASAPSME